MDGRTDREDRMLRLKAIEAEYYCWVSGRSGPGGRPYCIVVVGVMCCRCDDVAGTVAFACDVGSLVFFF